MTDPKATPQYIDPSTCSACSIKALTLWQPWAAAVAAGLKRYETRGWSTRYRGNIALHAAVRPLDKYAQNLADKFGLGELTFGAIVALVDLADCIQITPELIAAQSPTEIALGDWRVGRFAWKLENVRILTSPVVCRGAQGLWTFHHDLD